MANPTPSSPSLSAQNLFNVRGLVAVITGGGTGLGLMMTKTLSQNGASKIYILGRRLSILEKVAKEESSNNNIIPIQCDVTSKDSLSQAVQKISSEIGYINLLIANSGIEGPELRTLNPDASLEEFQKHCWDWNQDDFTRTYEVNLTALFNTCIAFLSLLSASNSKVSSTERNTSLPQTSQIITTTSVAAFNRIPMAGYAYGSSKAGAVHMSKQLASNLHKFGIRVNTIAPGLYPSEMTNENIEKNGEMMKKTIPLGRTGEESDMAGVVLWLSSKAGEWITGNVVVTDGGRLCVVPGTY